MKAALIAIAIFSLILAGCAAQQQAQDTKAPASQIAAGKAEATESITKEPFTMEKSNQKNPVAAFNTNYGTFKIELFEDNAPITAGNFRKLAKEGFYDGLTFHRVIKNFMIQGGDPSGDGTGDPGYTIEDEFYEGSSNVRGTISMANRGQDTGGSQFFINLVDNTFLDYDKPPTSSKHPVFGRVIENMEVIDRIAQVETLPGDRPREPVVISTITIEE
ncbi:TPA: peptidylprolyl isomerase [Candidatus Woesearchaeota archaeon]|nr:peptidylprolyl isomerase [Candidatus Woesearchaeota archaeon]HII68235.1 peptidylprolyl isomerase [Candidatus Woesearchaeota archaeon]